MRCNHRRGLSGVVALNGVAAALHTICNAVNHLIILIFIYKNIYKYMVLYRGVCIFLVI